MIIDESLHLSLWNPYLKAMASYGLIANWSGLGLGISGRVRMRIYNKNDPKTKRGRI